MLNQKQKEYCGYDPKLTGKGIRIAMIEFYSSPLFPQIRVGNPMNWPSTDTTSPPDYELNETNKPDNHPFKVASILRDMLPDAVIDFYCTDNSGLKEVLKGDYHIVSFSGTYCWADEDVELELAKKSFLVIGAGNNGSHGESDEALEPQWWPVGAMTMDAAGNVKFTDYSSWSKHAVKSTSFGDLQYKEGSDVIRGTSFATPFFVGLVGQYVQKYIQTFSVRPTVREIIDFAQDHCEPVLFSPVMEGAGILRLPKYWDLGLSMKIGSKEINVNGTKKQLNVAPKIENGNTMVQLSLLRELGVRVTWDEKNQRVAVRK